MSRPLCAALFVLVFPVIAASAAEPVKPSQALQPTRRAEGRTTVIPAGQDRAYDDYHYAPAVRAGNLVIVSGIPAGRGATYEEKVRTMFERLRTTLAAAGASMADVVEIQTFHREPRDTPAFAAEFDKFRKIHAEFFPSGYPAWTAVGTTALLSPDAPVELRAMAVIGSGKKVTLQRGDAKE